MSDGEELQRVPTGELRPEYSDESFWRKLRRFAKRAGRGVVEKALQLYFAMQRKDTPAWAKAVILGALAYFISPLDAVPDVIPGAGYVDDLGVIAAALTTVTQYIDEDVRRRAETKLKEWFG